MYANSKRNNYAIYLPVIASFLCVFCLMIIPINHSLRWLRPDLVTLVMIYWVANLPGSIGVVFAFFIGLAFDLLSGMLFGSMGLTLSIVAFLTLNLRLRLRMYNYWQKFIIIMLLVACSQLIRLWIQMIIGHPPANFLYWFSSIISAFMWPLVSNVLDVFNPAPAMAR